MKNGGYTVLEIMLIVAVMAIAAAIVGLSLNSVFALNVKGCAKNLTAELGKEKVAAMTRTGDVYLRLYQTEDGVWADRYENDVPVEQGVKLGKGSVSVRWYSDTNTAGTVLDETGIVLAYNRTDGSFMRIGAARALYDAVVPAYAGEYYTKITMTGGVSRSLILWPQTGKIELQG
jgi:hypothetical protein